MNLTKHSKERFIERTMGYKEEQEIAQYLTLNEKIVTERMMKLFESSEKIYRGKMKDYESADTYLNKNGWVFIVDYKKDCIVTVYQVDLKVDDEELNRIFCQKMINKINTIKQAAEEASFKSLESVENNKYEIKLIEEQIKTYNAMIENLNKRKKILMDENQLLQREVTLKEAELKQTVEDFISKRVF